MLFRCIVVSFRWSCTQVVLGDKAPGLYAGLIARALHIKRALGAARRLSRSPGRLFNVDTMARFGILELETGSGEVTCLIIL